MAGCHCGDMGVLKVVWKLCSRLGGSVGDSGESWGQLWGIESLQEVQGFPHGTLVGHSWRLGAQWGLRTLREPGGAL